VSPILDDAGEVFRSLVKQLILQRDPCDIPKHIMDIYERSEKDGSSRRSLTVEESVLNIITLSKKFSETFLVIDGIDQINVGTDTNFSMPWTTSLSYFLLAGRMMMHS